MRIFILFLTTLFLVACNSKQKAPKKKVKYSYSLTQTTQIGFSYPYTYTVYQPSSVGFYKKSNDTWAFWKTRTDFDSVEYRFYTDSTFSRHRFKKGHKYGENLFPPDTAKILKKRVLEKPDTGLLHFAHHSRETQSYQLAIEDSKAREHWFDFHSSYRCKDPFCEMSHGHLNFNSTSYSCFKNGWSFYFDELHKDSFTLGFAAKEEKIPLEIIKLLLEKHLFPEAAYEAVKSYYSEIKL